MKTVTKSKLIQLFEEAMKEQMDQQMGLEHILHTIEESLETLKEVDPKGYKLWMSKLEMFAEDIRIDTNQAVRWSKFS
jgi:uncharacterized protein YnzC (UPF0291/DUF896 family)